MRAQYVKKNDPKGSDGGVKKKGGKKAKKAKKALEKVSNAVVREKIAEKKLEAKEGVKFKRPRHKAIRAEVRTVNRMMQEESRKLLFGSDNKRTHKKRVEKPTKVYKPNVIPTLPKKFKTGVRGPKISLALPGSILNNVHTLLGKTIVANQIARTCNMFRVEEVVIFDDKDQLSGNVSQKGDTKVACELLRKLLLFHNTPPQVRKMLFNLKGDGSDADLQFSQILQTSGLSSHANASQFAEFRTGLVLDGFAENGMSTAQCNGKHKATLDKKLQPDMAVTLKFDPTKQGTDEEYNAVVVSPSEMEKKGFYAGFNIRVCERIEDVVDKSGEKKYDYVIGTSDKGSSVDDISLPIKMKSVLVVFGGVKGLEFALEDSEQKDTDSAFDAYLNCLPGQGTRTIRTEEAVPVVLAALDTKLKFLQ